MSDNYSATPSVSQVKCDGSPTTSSCDNARAALGVNPILYSQMLEMGVSRNLAIKSLLATGNNSIEAAFTWSAELSSDELEYISSQSFEDDSDQWIDIEENKEQESCSLPKMVCVVNSEHKMRTGKVAAQVGHAVLDLHRKIKTKGTIKQRGLLGLWSTNGEMIAVLRGDTREHLNALREEATGKRIISHIVCDAGRTQVAAGSQTVLALFGSSDDLDTITGKLKLL